MKYITRIIPLVLLIASGCSYSASPYRIGNQWYWAGDDNCRQGYVDKNMLVCHNAKGQPTGMRSPMTQQDMYMWNAQMQQQNAQMQMLDQSLHNMQMQQQMQQLNNNLFMHNILHGFRY